MVFALGLVAAIVVACKGGGGDLVGDSDGGSTSSSSSSSSSSSGGSSSGFITDGGPGNCSGPVTFRLTVDNAGGDTFCTGSSTCDATWLFVQKAADKSGVTIASNCTTACGACEQVGCPAICPQPNPVPKTGTQQVWDGRVFTSTKCTSKDGTSLTCDEPSCAPPGKYIAHMCAFRGNADAGAGPPNGCALAGNTPTQICTDVEFDLPANGPVVGTITP